jgi:hypothetical protein
VRKVNMCEDINCKTWNSGNYVYHPVKVTISDHGEYHPIYSFHLAIIYAKL